MKKEKYPWLIFGSSREVFGEAETLPVTEETPKNPINIYGITKLSGEELCRIYSKDYGLKTRILRFSNVYTGKNDQLDRVIPKFILRAARNEDLIINGTDEKILDFIYISDIIQGIWACIQEVEKSQQLYNDFNLVTGRGTSLKELAEIIIKEMKSKSQIRYTSNRPYDVKRFYGDSIKAKKILHFNPVIDIRKGIKLAIEEFRKGRLI